MDVPGEDDWPADGDGQRPAPPERRFHAECALCRGASQGGCKSRDDRSHDGDGADGLDGANVPGWGVWICNSCRQRNHDGIAPERHRAFVDQLRARGVPLELNAMGWIVLPD